MSEPSEFATLADSAIRMHEMYLSFRGAGFKRNESLRLVAYLVTAQGGEGEG